MTRIADRVAGMGTTVFAEMTALANEHKAVNLGQGFPDFPAPEFIKEAAVTAIKDDINQYAPGRGHAALREAIAAKYRRDYDLLYDPAAEIGITVGATEAIFAGIMGLVNPGDEVILFEPFYDSYVPSVQFAGGRPVFYTLRPPDWSLDLDALRGLMTNKTRLIVINTPNNPTGKVFTQAELEGIAALCQEHDIIALTDEVYEHIVFDGKSHIPLATLPGMWERTLTISSIGKTFSVTGWKVGWKAGPADLVTAAVHARQFISYSGASPLQHASITALNAPADYYTGLSAMYQANRDFLVGGLTEAGLKPINPAGTYFVMADISDLGFESDVAFCRHLTTAVGVTAIPPGSFYENPEDGYGLARFAFCKRREVLEEAVNRLKRGL